ncbi:hypothetical protein Tco_0736187 [Tanacetum coccineum]
MTTPLEVRPRFEALPPIIHVDDNENFIDDEDDVPHDLADSDNEVFAIFDDDDDKVATMAATVVRGHGGDGAGEPPRPLPRQFGTGCRGSRARRGRGRGGKDDGRKGRATCVDHDGIKSASALMHISLSAMKTTSADSVLVEPEERSRATVNAQNMTRNMIFSRHVSRSLGVTRYQYFESQESHPYLILLARFYDLHTREGVWLPEEARLQYEEMLKLQGLGVDRPIEVPCTEEEIFSKAIKGNQQGYGRGRQREQQLARAKEEAKAYRRELDEVLGVLKTDPRMAELLSQIIMAEESSVKEMTTNFGKLDKYEGHNFRRWQKKMQFLLPTIEVVYFLSTPMPDLLEDDTLEANVKSAKELWDSLKSKYMAEDASSKKFLISNFNNYKMVDSRPCHGTN